jgi:cation diffusion facilitator CzcD-associated flavoprotein CzcO
MPPLKVAVIGGGPAAMFFCHSYQKQRAAASGDAQEEPPSLEITCFEKKESPGGVWRASLKGSDHNSEEENDSCRIYDELWTNGPSSCIEFYDHTFQQHFGDTQVPMYFPRTDVHDYIVGRCLKDNPNFFDEFFRCHTEVLHVAYEESIQKFAITTRDVLSSQTSQHLFDKCIWAGGQNGIKSIPRSLREMFQNDDTTCNSPLLLHSTETHHIRQHCVGKTILLIGGSYSAEDLALQCLKWGCEKVHISTRDVESAVTWTSAWPANKVQVHAEVAVHSVQGNAVHFQRVKWTWPDAYVPVQPEYDSEDETESESDSEEEDEEEKKDQDDDEVKEKPVPVKPALTLTDISMVVFCTGYRPNLTMMAEELRPANDTIPQWNMGENEPFQFDSQLLNEDWRMNEDPAENPASAYTGHVPPRQGRMIRLNYNHPDMHRGVLFKNPNMMYLCEHGFDVPLMAIDVHAWLLCSWLTGRVQMPSVDELRKENEQQVVDQLHVPYLRYCMDEGYCWACDSITEPGFWRPVKGNKACAWWEIELQYERYCLRLLAKVMEEGQYPGASLGTYQQLNENGEAIYDFNYRCYWNRSKRKHDTENLDWKTFRDDTVQPPHCYSLYTKTKARPLKQKWLDATGPVSIQKGDV